MTTTSWYIYCHDAHSNEVVSTALHGLQSNSDFMNMECADGKKRPMYYVPDYSFASRLFRSQKTLGIKITIYTSKDGITAKEWVFETKKKKSFAQILAQSDKLKAKLGKKSATRF